MKKTSNLGTALQADSSIYCKFGVTSDDMFASAFRYASIGMALVGPDGSWLRVNPALCDIVGYTEDELYTKTFQDITHPDDLNEDLAFVQQMLDGVRDTYQMEKRYFHKDGRIIYILLGVSMVHNCDGSPAFFISQIQDITKRKELEAELVRFATEDALTGVHNRRYFFEYAGREMARGVRFREPQAIMMLDIDNFKRINDTYGHDIGDQVLKVMAQTSKSALREVDIFGRLGGEEFGALLINTDSEMAYLVADRLRKKLEGCIVETDKGPVTFTVSIGLSTFTGGKYGVESRLKTADEALYKAKESGRNRVVTTNEEIHFEPASLGLQAVFVKLIWKPEYESGNPVIDEQHKTHFDISNVLLSSMLGGRPADEITSVANELTSHVVKHFRDEDAIYRANAYPLADEHSRIHNQLVQAMTSMLRRYSAGTLAVGELFSFLAVDVVSQHMLNEDRKFFPYIQGIQSNVTP